VARASLRLSTNGLLRSAGVARAPGGAPRARRSGPEQFRRLRRRRSVPDVPPHQTVHRLHHRRGVHPHEDRHRGSTRAVGGRGGHGGAQLLRARPLLRRRPAEARLEPGGFPRDHLHGLRGHRGHGRSVHLVPAAPGCQNQRRQQHQESVRDPQRAGRLGSGALQDTSVSVREGEVPVVRQQPGLHVGGEPVHLRLRRQHPERGEVLRGQHVRAGAVGLVVQRKGDGGGTARAVFGYW